MLTPAQAKEALKEFKAPEGKSPQFDRVTALPPMLRTVGYFLLNRDINGKLLSSKDAVQPAADAPPYPVETLTEAERRQLFGALFPKIAETVEAAWHLWNRLPYQSGYGYRKSFRAPGHADALSNPRSNWLRSLLSITNGYDQDVVWYAAWATHVGGYHGDTLGILFAAAIDAGGPTGDQVFNILIDTAKGDHPTGVMGRHVSRGLLVASRPDGWQFMEKMLLAAQRQEGLRQVIFETIDDAHPEAFRRMLRLIVEHDLIRFSSAIRAVDVWFGFGWDAMDARFARQALGDTLTFLEDASARDTAIADASGQTLYLAFWSLAVIDAAQAIAPASAALTSDDPERRFVAAHLLAALGLRDARIALLPALADPDLRVAAEALGALQHTTELTNTDLFERLEQEIPRFPKKPMTLDPLVWSWSVKSVSRETIVGAFLPALGDRSPLRLIPYLPEAASYSRAQIARLLAQTKPWNPAQRDTLFALVGDPTEYVRETALKALADCSLTPDEAKRMESLLTRKSEDLRRGIFTLLLTQPDADAVASAERLTTASRAELRLAGLETLRLLVKADRAVDTCRKIAQTRKESGPALSDIETPILDALLDVGRVEPTLDDALGLMDPANRSKPTPPKMPRKWLVFTGEKTPLESDAAEACAQSLDKLIHQYREAEVTLEHYNGEKEQKLLGSVQHGFPVPPSTGGESAARLPLHDIWQTWWETRPKNQRDPDGFELLRAIVRNGASKSRQIRYPYIVSGVIDWLLYLNPPANAPDFLIDAVETHFSQVSSPLFAGVATPGEYFENDWRNGSKWYAWLQLARNQRALHPTDWTPAHHARLWGLLRWRDEPRPGVRRLRPAVEEAAYAAEIGVANRDDLFDQLLGPRSTPNYGGPDFSDLRQLTRRKRNPLLNCFPLLDTAVTQARERVIEVELGRGDMPTAASYAALALGAAGGADTLARLLAAFGKDTFARGYGYSPNKSSVFSHLIRATFPTDADTPEAFAKLMADAKIPEQRLIETAVYAPQWAKHAEYALNWIGFAEAVWWLHAHTKDVQWSVDADVREGWAAEAAALTPLSAQTLLDGAVDVEWFGRVYKALGAKRWAMLDDAAKFASGGGGHKRAQLFAAAMLGQTPLADLKTRIRDKRNQDAVRALGLVPLPNGAKREDDILARYAVMQEFGRGSRQFGSQRQASEKLSVGIGLENLARTAGYPDPVRLEWAMEAKSVADLAAGPVSAEAGPVQVMLSINEWGTPEIAATKNGKPIKAIPAAAKKLPEIAALTARKTEIERQASRMRLSLEAAMCRGDAFTGTELRRLLQHPVLAPMLRSFILVGPGDLTGYAVDGGQSLEAYDDTVRPVGDKDLLKIAHAHDLLTAGYWQEWQRECFQRERIQPFKQVFRELYVLTAAEKADGIKSQRYAGHQVNPKQALALLGRRGWVGNPNDGDVRRTFHDAGISADVSFDYGYTTPAEAEGLTIDAIVFTKRGDWKPLPLTEVCPRVFSEAMRDLDLVVSVAHQGGVDPEASASTVEMRTTLLREACALMKLENVCLVGNHALIDGHLANYSMHLGSASVHRQPGGQLCIVPVHSQHRGRVFLPFADDDPRTTEVLSKVLLLSKDTEIKDPVILEQIYA